MKMTKLLYFMILLLVPAGYAHADLDTYLKDINLFAHANRSEFLAQLSARFHIGRADIEVLLSNVENPADVALVLWLGEKSGQPRDRVLNIYREKQSQGWGAMAQSLGIKPGSSEFHALKEGNLDFSSTRHNSGKSKRINGSGKNQGKGKSK